MKLPWDKTYLKIAFHVIVTLGAVYILFTLVDAVASMIGDLGSVFDAIFSAIRRFLSIMSPAITAFVIAYLFDPIVDVFQKQYEQHFIPFFKKHKLYRQKKIDPDSFKKRFAGSMITYIVAFSAIALLIRLLANNLGITDGGFFEMVNRTVASFNELANRLEESLEEWGFAEIGFLDDFSYWIESTLLEFVNSAMSMATAAGAWVLNLFISLVVAFYFMNNKHRLTFQFAKLMELFLPNKIYTVTGNFLGDLHAVFSGYIRGLILDGIILGTLIGIGLSIVGVELAILIAVFTAIFNLIPFFGGIIAFFLAVVSELLIGSPLTALYAAIVILIIQQIDTMFIVPKVVGERVSLSPPIVMLSLTIAGSILGLWGMLLIVPTIAMVKIFVMRFIERYIERKKYKTSRL